MAKSIMWNYMHEEKELLSSLLRSSNVKTSISHLDKIEALYIVAHGSSYNAAHAAAPFIMRQAGVRVYVYTPSAFRYNASRWKTCQIHWCWESLRREQAAAY